MKIEVIFIYIESNFDCNIESLVILNILLNIIFSNLIDKIVFNNFVKRKTFLRKELISNYRIFSIITIVFFSSI